MYDETPETEQDRALDESEPSPPAEDRSQSTALTRLLAPLIGHGPASAVAWVVETALLLVAAFLLAQVVRTYVVQPYIIPSGSMEPTIAISDRVLVNKFIYRFEDPQPGDVVVFTDPTGETPALIKRVIAVGGQTVDLREGAVYVDDKPLVEPYTYGKPSDPGNVEMPLTVPADEIWVMGDNRTNSKDSRWIGPQPLSAVLGRAFATYWPIERMGPLK